MKVEFQKKELPQKPEELGPFLEDVRRAMVAGGEATDEMFKKVEAELKRAFESIEKNERNEKRLSEMEETLKAMHEAGRIHNDDKLVRQLRSLPVIHKVEKDEDYRGKATSKVFNLLALSRKQLSTYLDGEALSWALRLRRLNNQTLTAHHIMSMVTANNPQRAEDYRARGGMKGLPMWDALQETAKEGARAIDIATSGGVSEWIPTVFSADKFDDVRDQLAAGSLFRILPMPQSPWKIPTLTAFMTGYLIPEAQADATGSNTQITASDPTSSNATLTAKKLATLSWFSNEVEQDSIVAILPMYDEEQAYAQAIAVEQAIVNGQLTSVIDSGSSPAATDPRAGFDGLRRAGSLIGSSVDLSAGLTAEKLASAIGIAGKYANPNDCAYLSGYVGLARALVLKDGNGNLVYLTRERAGDAATLFTGQVGILMGYPFVVSGVFPANMNAAGVIDGVTTTRTGFLLVNRRPWLGGQRQGLEVAVSRDERFSYDQIGVRSTQRFAFQALLTPSSTRPFVVPLVGLQ